MTTAPEGSALDPTDEKLDPRYWLYKESPAATLTGNDRLILDEATAQARAAWTASEKAGYPGTAEEVKVAAKEASAKLAAAEYRAMVALGLPRITSKVADDPSDPHFWLYHEDRHEDLTRHLYATEREPIDKATRAEALAAKVADDAATEASETPREDEMFERHIQAQAELQAARYRYMVSKGMVQAPYLPGKNPSGLRPAGPQVERPTPGTPAPTEVGSERLNPVQRAIREHFPIPSTQSGPGGRSRREVAEARRAYLKQLKSQGSTPGR